MTEQGTGPNKLLETYVSIISNAKCQKLMNSRLRRSNSKFPNDAKEFVVKSLPNGLNDNILCTAGLRNEKSGTFSVSAHYKNMYFFFI